MKNRRKTKPMQNEIIPYTFKTGLKMHNNATDNKCTTYKSSLAYILQTKTVLVKLPSDLTKMK